MSFQSAIQTTTLVVRVIRCVMLAVGDLDACDERVVSCGQLRVSGVDAGLGTQFTQRPGLVGALAHLTAVAVSLLQ